MPRGVAIPELRQRLFEATERLLLRGGPSALSSRAITTEAGCAKGVLHNHFTDLDEFLTEFVLARFHGTFEEVAQLRERAGLATVADNLARSASALLGAPILAVHDILTVRPSVAARLSHGHHAPDLAELEDLFAAYLEREKELGRVRPAADSGAAALAIVATVHRIHTSPGSPREAGAALDRVLTIVVSAIT